MTLNCKGHLLSLESPIVMGILNITPDSFYDGGRYQMEHEILSQAEKMLTQGARILDIGGMSSRPGAQMISPEEEIQRVLPAITCIRREFPEALLSIDTVWSAVAFAAVEEGVSIINDISAYRYDPKLPEVAVQHCIPYILMHMQGQAPKDMQDNPNYDNPVLEIIDFFIAKVAHLRRMGLKDIVLDPGFGFGKSIHHNYVILKGLHQFQLLELPILAGISRKSMIYKYLNTESGQALNGTTALHMVALQQGAKILRVHDVKEAVEVIKLWQKLEAIS